MFGWAGWLVELCVCAFGCFVVELVGFVVFFCLCWVMVGFVGAWWWVLFGWVGVGWVGLVFVLSVGYFVGLLVGFGCGVGFLGCLYLFLMFCVLVFSRCLCVVVCCLYLVVGLGVVGFGWGLFVVGFDFCIFCFSA